MFGCFLNTSTSAVSSAKVYTAPDGLHGDENINTFVLGVIAASNSAAVVLNWLATVVLISTTLPRAIFTSYE